METTFNGNIKIESIWPTFNTPLVQFIFMFSSVSGTIYKNIKDFEMVTVGFPIDWNLHPHWYRYCNTALYGPLYLTKIKQKF